jgi:hypothetical protein
MMLDAFPDEGETEERDGESRNGGETWLWLEKALDAASPCHTDA